MALISLYDGGLSFGDGPLLDKAELHVEPHERLCLVGRNGAGKSTLLKVLNREIELEDGSLVYQQGTGVARLQQEPPRDVSSSVYDFVADGLAEQAHHLRRYHELTCQAEPDAQALTELVQVQELLEHHGLWQLENRINQVLEQLGLNADDRLASLSGGWLRKAALAKALVSNPQVLLLDEPTNHLDIDTIHWLEGFLQTFSGSLVFISHDRSFIRQMATRIVDLDRGQLVSYPGNYDHYLRAKAQALQTQAAQHAEFDRRLALEEQWIRQGIKARRTRNEGRVRALKMLRRERGQRREVQGVASMQTVQAERSGKIIFALEQVNYWQGERQLVKDFTAQMQRGDKVALIGANGCGKTTLLKLMTGQLTAQSGRIQMGSNLQVAYFDQHRLTLDLDKTVMDNVAEGRQEVMVNGKPRHVFSYLQDFLFHPKRAMTPVSALSGGERNRLLLAKLFLKPSNLLILDEPTNDLDVETLELLEELVADYQGTVLLVSHDRNFVDNTATECWIFEGNGVIGRYAGGYEDARQQQQASQALRQKPVVKTPAADKSGSTNKAQPQKRSNNRLSWQQQQELAQLPQQIEALERRMDELKMQINDSEFFNQPYATTHQVLEQLANTGQEMERAFARWEELEAQVN